MFFHPKKTDVSPSSPHKISSWSVEAIEFQHKKLLKIKFIYSLRPYIWYVRRYSLSAFFILQLITLVVVYPRAKFYSSRPSIWYVIQYPSGNFFILHMMTLEHPRAKLYFSRPFIWYVTWYHLGIFFHFALDDPWPPPGWNLLLETFHLICHTILFE